MGLLKPATNVMAYAKVGVYGSAGAGKTFTASKIAIGLHKAIGSKKPIAAFDTEPAFSFVLPMFQAAGIELLVANQSRALVDLMSFMDEAEAACDIAIIDSITHVWRDAQTSFLERINETRKKSGRRPLPSLEFQHWGPIKDKWGEFSDRFLSSKLHCIVCGRAGQVYEYQDKDDGSGKKELISTGTRMATEKELGHEPSLLIEMVSEKRDGKLVNVAVIHKDRADKLNGMDIVRPDFDKLRPHFDTLNLGGEHFGSMEKRDSKAMFEATDEGGFDKEKQQRAIWSEEILEILKKHFPSQSVEDKQKRADLLEMYADTRSWSKVEGMRSEDLKAVFEALKAHLEPPPEPPSV